MKTYLECLPCLVRQSLEAARHATPDEQIHEQVLRKVLDALRAYDLRRPPPVAGGLIHRIVRESTGLDDPYRISKQICNRKALEIYPEMKEFVRQSPDPLGAALRLSIAGNAMDFAVHSRADRQDIRQIMTEAVSRHISTATLREFREHMDRATAILYLGDNAGEIVFDRLLVEELPAEKITFVVKGGPVINDVTREDAEITGITDLVEVIDNGSDIPGTIPGECSPEFVRRFEQSDLIISKGQGNYECLSDVRRDIYFLFKAKCPVITMDVKCASGTYVVALNRR